MINSYKKALFMCFILMAAFIILELFSFIFLKVYYGYRIKKSDYPKMFEDTLLYLSFSRFHPLLAKNDDLRARHPSLDFDPIVGYKFAPNTIHIRPYSGYTGHIEIDSEGFPHNGDYYSNKRLFSQPSDKIYRVVFLGGSTAVGRGATSNKYTIPAHFQRLLEKQWKGVAFHVINAGNWGYQSTQERLYYSFYIKPFKPNLLIFIDGDNDSFCSAIQKEWTPYFTDMGFTNAKYRNLFRPLTAFANYIQSLLTFPQPLYTLFFINKFLYKTNVIKMKFTGPERQRKFVFHKEGVIQLKDNLLTIAREIYFENSRAIFCLQPILGIGKNIKSASEERTLKKAELIYPDYLKVLTKYFHNFSEVYDELEREFVNNEKINFVDLSNTFENTGDDIYVSIWHYNDYGNMVFAERIFTYAKEKIRKDLIKKGLILER